jgi:hypothetical protein
MITSPQPVVRGYVLSLSPSPSGDVAGSNTEFNIRYSGSLAGNRQEGHARVVVRRWGEQQADASITSPIHPNGDTNDTF